MYFSTTTFTLAALFGLSHAAPSPSPDDNDYIPGNCGVHVTQWQKNENGVEGDYQFDFKIADGGGNTAGQRTGVAIPDYQSTSVPSFLPYLLTVGVGAVDSDPLQFAYAGQKFSSSDGCSTGKYDGGKREMDCGFGC